MAFHESLYLLLIQISYLCLTAYFWLVSAFSMGLAYLVCLVCYPFVDQKTFSRIYEYIPATIVLYAMIFPNFWSLKIIDLRRDKSWTNKRYIIVANHVSFIDSLVTCCIPLKKKYMIAEVFTKVPVFGWLSLSSGHVTVDRHKPNRMADRSKSGVLRAEKAMGDGCSFLLYPEGMRTLDPYNLCEFKTGAFHLALTTGVEILPVTIQGTGEAMPLGGMVGLADIQMTIGEPFKVNHIDNIDSSVNRVRTFIENTLKR